MATWAQSKYALVAAGTAIAAGIVLASYSRIDQPFGILSAAEGQVNSVSLRSDAVYEQPIHLNRSTLSRIGLHLRPLTRSIPNEPVTIEVVQGGSVLARQLVAAPFLDAAGATAIRLDPPLTVTPGEVIHVRVSVPPALSNKVGLQLHIPDTPDEVTDAQHINLLIDGDVQDAPAAYEAYYASRAALPLQVSGLFIIGGVLLLLARYASVSPRTLVAAYTAGVVAAYLVPAYLNGYGVILLPLFVVVLAIFSTMYWLLRKSETPILASLFGAQVVAFSTYIPLHFIGRGASFSPLALRDFFLDTNQILPSHAAGSYIGFPVFFVFVLGVAVLLYRRTRLDITIAIIGILGLAATYTVSAHLIITVTAAIAYTSGHGLAGLHRFLGKDDRLSTGIIAALIAIALLDMWHVSGDTFQYHTLL